MARRHRVWALAQDSLRFGRPRDPQFLDVLAPSPSSEKLSHMMKPERISQPVEPLGKTISLGRALIGAGRDP